MLIPGEDVLKESNKLFDGLSCGLYFFEEGILNEEIDSSSFCEAVVSVFDE